MRRKEILYILKKCQKCINDCKQQSCCENAEIAMCKNYKKLKKSKQKLININNK